MVGITAEMREFLEKNESWSEFYRSLLGQLNSRGTLSPKQVLAIEKGMEKAKHRKPFSKAPVAEARPLERDSRRASRPRFSHVPFAKFEECFRKADALVGTAKEDGIFELDARKFLELAAIVSEIKELRENKPTPTRETREEDPKESDDFYDLIRKS